MAIETHQPEQEIIVVLEKGVVIEILGLAKTFVTGLNDDIEDTHPEDLKPVPWMGNVHHSEVLTTFWLVNSVC
jgi:hypothetical protein